MPIDAQVVAFADQAEVVAAMDVGIIWDRLKGEFLNEYVRLERQGLSPDQIDRALRAFMDGLSEKPLEDLARKSTNVVYNQGRAAEIRSQPVEMVVRSEILDENTCSECAALDGMIVAVDDPDFDRLMPPAFCLGGDRCRGFYIPVSSMGV